MSSIWEVAEREHPTASVTGAVDTEAPRRVVVTDIEMPFRSMVTFMVKWALASIPAVIILFGLAMALMSLLALVGVALR